MPRLGRGRATSRGRSGIAATPGSVLARSPLHSPGEIMPPKSVDSCRVFCHFSIRSGSRFGGKSGGSASAARSGRGKRRSPVSCGEAGARRSIFRMGSEIDGSGSRQNDHRSGAVAPEVFAPVRVFTGAGCEGARCVAVRKDALAKHCRERVTGSANGPWRSPWCRTLVPVGTSPDQDLARSPI